MNAEAEDARSAWSPDPQRCGGLGRSVSGCAGADEGRPAKKPRKAAAGQKEMLMPIEGKKPKEVPAKKPAARPQRKSARCKPKN